MKGLAHLTDWYITVAEGIAGVNASADGGWAPPDGHNLWPALTGVAAADLVYSDWAGSPTGL